MKDPLESTNVAGRPGYAEVQKTLMKKLWTWMKDTDDPLPEGLPKPVMHHKTLTMLREASGE